MSGPDYPRPVPGSNAIGSFIIGVSPIGAIRGFDVWRTIISQYANSPILDRLITDFDDCVDQTANIDAFFDYIWNVDTARGHGLDVLGAIVGVKRTLHVATVSYFGFAEAGLGAHGFDQQSFYAGAPVTENYDLSDDAYRVLIFAKALANISDGGIPGINQLLLSLFPHRGNCYVKEGEPLTDAFGFAEANSQFTFGEGTPDAAPFNGPGAQQKMTMTYMFEFALSPVEQAIVEQSGVLPKPPGVKVSYVQSY